MTAEANKADFSPEVYWTVLRNFYVDDLSKSVKTVEEAIALV
jgi:hypothetical protein